MTKKSAVIFFHKNILKLYKKHWIDKCVDSILNQNYQEFDIFEINYGNEDFSVLENKILRNKNHFFYKENFPTHVEAMVYLLNKCFVELDYEYVFNTNLDDYYKPQRFEKQIECGEKGYVLSSSLWNYFREDIDFEEINFKEFNFENLKIKGEKYATFKSVKNRLNNQHNVINHSGVCFSRKFWEGYDIHGNKLRYRNDKPFEDLTLWMRAINNDYLLTVINENLITYRLHENQIGNNSNNNSQADKGFTQPDFTPIRYGIILIAPKEKSYLLSRFIKSYNNLILKNNKKVLFIVTDSKEIVKESLDGEDINYFIEEIQDKDLSDNLLIKKVFGVFLEIYCDKFLFLKLDKKISYEINEENFDFWIRNSLKLQIDSYKMFLEESFKKYYSDEKTIEYFNKIYLSRYETFKVCMNRIFEYNYNNIVELGTIRSFVDGAYEGCNSDDKKYWEPYNPEKWDWSSGLFTYIFGEYIHNSNKKLFTIDISNDHINRCKLITNKFKNNIDYINASSEDFLKNFKEKIDFIYIDTGDLNPVELNGKLHLLEVKIIVERDLLNKDGIILIDDVKNLNSKAENINFEWGTAQYAIEYLLDNGFRILFDEYQVILVKS